MSTSAYYSSTFWPQEFWPEGFWPEATVTERTTDALIQAGLAVLLQALDDFADDDVSTDGDFRVLGRRSGQQAVIYPLALEGMRAGDWSQVRVVWRHAVELWVDFPGDDLSGLMALRQSVLDQLAAYPTLNGVARVTDARVERCSEVLWLYGKATTALARPVKAGFRLTVRTVEERLYTGSGEFAGG